MKPKRTAAEHDARDLMTEFDRPDLDAATHQALQHELLAVLREIELDAFAAPVAATGMSVAELRRWLEAQMREQPSPADPPLRVPRGAIPSP